MTLTLECPLLAQSRHSLLHRTCPLLTQSGHRRPTPSSKLVYMSTMSVLSVGGSTLLGGTVAALSIAARAQGERMRRIGVLMGLAENDPQTKERLAGFREGLERRGWTEGHDLRIDYRFAGDGPDRYQSLAKELVALKPDVILAHSTPIAIALQRESREIQIVFVAVSDPIGSGLVANLARPGGNLTGALYYEE